jgi:hypothetical protein
MSGRAEFVDLVTSAGPTPDGVDQITHIIASVPAGQLNHAARRAAPTYEQLVYDKEQGGDLQKYMRENPTLEIALANEVMLRQQKLSAPSRRLATAACFLALFAGGTYTQYKTYKDLDKGTLSQAQADTTEHLEGEVLVGGLAGAVGGVITYFTTLAMAGKLARRPAQKIVRQAEQSPT